MPTQSIESYQAVWSVTEHKGTIVLKVDGQPRFAYPDNAAEFMAIVDLLRNEKPLGFLDDGGNLRIVTGNEEIGEEET